MQTGSAAHDTDQKEGNVMYNNPNPGNSRKEKQMNAGTKRTPLVALIALTLATTCLAEEWPVDPAKADFHVAVTGKDTNPGTAAAPFATVQAARDTVRKKIAAGLTGDVVVLIHGGTYRVTETIAFGPEDSGTEKLAITYAAAPGEKVVLSGGRRITGWIADMFARPDAASGEIAVTISVRNDGPVAAAGLDVSLAPGLSEHELVLTVPQPRLWNLDDPFSL